MPFGFGSDQLLEYGVPVALIAVALAGGFLYQRHLREQEKRWLPGLAQALGAECPQTDALRTRGELQLEDDVPVFDGAPAAVEALDADDLERQYPTLLAPGADPVAVTLYVDEIADKDRYCVDLRVWLDARLPEFTIAKEGAVEKLAKRFGAHDVEVGAPEFDKKVRIKSAAPDQVDRAWFQGSEVQNALVDLVEAGPVRHEAGLLQVRWRGRSGRHMALPDPRQVARLTEALRFVAGVLRVRSGRSEAPAEAPARTSAELLARARRVRP